MNPPTSTTNQLVFSDYEPGGFFDELIDVEGRPRPGASLLVDKINSLEAGELLRRQEDAERSLFVMGITFSVYGDEQGTEKIFPFDIVPRIVGADEWDWIERGLKQRIRAADRRSHRTAVEIERRRHAPVDLDGLGGDVACRVRGEERHHVGDVLG